MESMAILSGRESVKLRYAKERTNECEAKSMKDGGLQRMLCRRINLRLTVRMKEQKA